MLALAGTVLTGVAVANASDFNEPWKRPDRALVIDAYEYNPIDWNRLVGDKRIVGFINKGSDGLSPPYKCSGNATEVRLCKALWKRHAVARELFQTRRTVAKALGLKWGAYHLARPGNPIDQANNFIDFTEPAPDDLIALDIEENDPQKWMSLSDAEIFARHIYARLGRWPVLYTNGSTALHIAENREKYPILSRLTLWYARYKPTIGLHFPKGNWETYTLWQFAAGANCDARSCPYRVPGTPLDIDVNVASMSAEELRKAWPFGKDLIGKRDFPARNNADEVVAQAETGETVPLPVGRKVALGGGDVTVQFAALQTGANEAKLPGTAKVEAAAEVEPMQPPAVEKAARLVGKEIVELTGEEVPLPVARKEARRKRGDVTVRFVAVERVVVKTEAVEALADAVVAEAAYRSPFRALLGKQAEPDLPIVMTNYVAATEIARRLRVRAKVLEQRAAAVGQATMPGAGAISTAAMDDPGPVISATRYTRKDLPVYLIRKIDGPSEEMP